MGALHFFLAAFSVCLYSRWCSAVNITALQDSLINNVYDGTIESSNSSSPFHWNEVRVTVVDHVAHELLLRTILPNPGRAKSSFFVEQPVYISLTTMSKRMDIIDITITNLLQARIVPTMIYLFISKEAFLLDTGVNVIPLDLLCFVAAGYLRIVYTQNHGPHRKLLPLLKRHWGDDLFIVTMDDDMEHDQCHVILYQLLKYYVMGGMGSRMVALRARRIGLCKEVPLKSSTYHSWSVNFQYNRTEMLVLPTGNGGVLYKPTFFHEAIFNKGVRRMSMTADDVTFRMATLMNSIPVQLGCIPLRSNGHLVRECEYDEIDSKYDQIYGKESTVYYYEAVANVTQKLVRKYEERMETERAAALAITSETAHPVDQDIQVLSEDNELSMPTDISEPADARRILVRVRVKKVSKNMNGSDLFSYNKQGGNNHAWQTTVKVFKSLKIFDFEVFAGNYLGEREDHCLDDGLPYREAAKCSIYNCIRNGTSWIIAQSLYRGNMSSFAGGVNQSLLHDLEAYNVTGQNGAPLLPEL